LPGDWHTVESPVAEHVGPLGAAFANGAASTDMASPTVSTEVRIIFLLRMVTPVENRVSV
jgi:hypothetical protein